MKELIIYGTVILYNPDDNTYDNIESYVDYIDRLVVVDNSTSHNISLVNKLKENFDNIIYVNNHDNIGMATALNIGCDEAIKLGADWILTMDQDSKFLDFKEYLNCFYSVKGKENISIISPNSKYTEKPETVDCQCVETMVTITSGSLVNLLNFELVGRFTDKLFIDEVDHDYCLRSLEQNLKVLLFENIPLIHSLGEKKLVGVKVRKYHSTIRMYYITRNSFYMASRFNKSFPELYSYRNTFYFDIIKTLRRVIKYEENKLEKIKNIFLGLYDFLRGKYGKK